MGNLLRFAAFAVALFCFTTVSAAAEYKKATKVGTPNFASLGCKKGEFWDPINGGECWSCSGENRTIFPVTGSKACQRPASESLKKASRKSKDAFKCGSGSFFDPRKGGECWSCPKGYKRSLAAVTAKDACTKAVKRKNKKAKYSYNTGSLLKACKKGTFANVGSTKCYKCPKGYKHDAGKKVSKSGVCYKPPYTAKKKASKVKSLSGLKCPKGQFFDPIDNGSCWTCPKNYKRTAYSVKSSKACSKAIAAAYSKAKKKSSKKMTLAKAASLGCKKGSFFDLTDGGSCWSCPSSNPVRTLYAVTTKQACASKTCGKLNGRPCYVYERFPSCNKGLLEDPIANKCVKPQDLACNATIGALAAIKKLSDEAHKARNTISNAALDAIPGARGLLRFMQNQSEQLKKEQAKLMKQVDLSKVTKQLEALALKSPDEIERLAEMAKTFAKAHSKIIKVFLDPKIMCSGSGSKIANAFKKTGLESIFASADPSFWRHLNPIASAHAAASPENQLAIDLAVTPPLPDPYNGLSIGIGFATDFAKNHSLTFPTIAYAKSVDTDFLETTKKSAGVSLSLGWAHWDGTTNWGKNDVFNWAATLQLTGFIGINIGSGGFGGISLTPGDLFKYEVKEITNFFGPNTIQKTVGPAMSSVVSAGIGGGGGFNIPLK